MQKIKPNHSGLFILPLLLMASFLALLPSVQVSEAATPTIAHSNAATFLECVAATCTATLTVGTVGSIIVLVEETGSQRTVNTPTDNLSPATTFVKQTTCTDGTFQNVCIWTGTSKASGLDVITATVSGGNSAIDLWAYEVTGGFLDNACSAHGTGTQNSGNPFTFTTSASCTFTLAHAVLFAGVNNGGAVAELIGAGYTGCTGIVSVGRACEFDNSAAVSTPTSFPFTANCGLGCSGWNLDGLMIADTQTIVTVIGACTFFQLQCWWYPLLFMGLYSGFLLMVASSVKATSKGKSHIFISAVTFGSLVAVIFGIMNIVFPLLMLVLNTIIVLRLR